MYESQETELVIDAIIALNRQLSPEVSIEKLYREDCVWLIAHYPDDDFRSEHAAHSHSDSDRPNLHEDGDYVRGCWEALTLGIRAPSGEKSTFVPHAEKWHRYPGVFTEPETGKANPA